MNWRITLLEQKELGLREDEEPKRSNCNTCVTRSRDFSEIADISANAIIFTVTREELKLLSYSCVFPASKQKQKQMDLHMEA